MRKTPLYLLMAAFVVSALFSGCKKDKEEDTPTPPKNYVTYDGKEYMMPKGLLTYYGDPDAKAGTYNFDVTLLSEGITYNATTDVFAGQGHVFYLQLYSSSATALVPGTYTYKDDGNYSANSFDFGFLLVNYVVSTQASEIEKEIAGGTLVVAKSGDVYTLTINTIAEDGKAVIGSYTGTLQYVDFSTKKK